MWISLSKKEHKKLWPEKSLTELKNQGIHGVQSTSENKINTKYHHKLKSYIYFKEQFYTFMQPYFARSRRSLQSSQEGNSNLELISLWKQDQTRFM